MTLAYRADEFFEPVAVRTADRKYLADRKFARRKRATYQIETGLEEAPVIAITSGTPPSDALLQTIDETVGRFVALKGMEIGWDSYQGQRVQRGAIAPALTVALVAIQRCHPPRVELNSEGGVDLVWERVGRTLSLSADATGEFEVYFEDGDQIEEPEGLVSPQIAEEYALRYCS